MQQIKNSFIHFQYHYPFHIHEVAINLSGLFAKSEFFL